MFLLSIFYIYCFGFFNYLAIGFLYLFSTHLISKNYNKIENINLVKNVIVVKDKIYSNCLTINNKITKFVFMKQVIYVYNQVELVYFKVVNEILDMIIVILKSMINDLMIKKMNKENFGKNRQKNKDLLEQMKKVQENN
mgnify:CR=1 FL=1